MNHFFKRLAPLNRSGIVSPLILIGIVSVLVLFVVLGNLPIKDKLLGTLFPKQFSRAAGGIVDLSLLPAAATVAPGSTFNLSVVMDTKTASASAAIVDLSWDPAVLQVQSFNQGTFLKGLFPLNPNPFFDNTLGRGIIYLNVGVVCSNPFDQSTCTPNPPAVGSGVLAIIQFKALQATTTASAINLNPTVYSGSNYSSGTIVTATYISSTNASNPGDVTGILTPSSVTVANNNVVKTADFSLSPSVSTEAGGVEFPVQVKVLSDTDSANLFAAKLNFDPTQLMVSRIDATGSFITQWADQSFDNSAGKVSLVGGVPAPGFKTSGSAATEATVYFKGLSAGTSSISFDGTSAVYRNSDNVNILDAATSTGSSVTITSVAPSPSPSVQPLPSPSPSVAPSPSPVPSPSVSPSAAPSTLPSPSAVPSPSALPSVAPSPSPSPIPVACSITSANWITSTNPANEGQVVGLNVVGNSSCAGQNVSFTVLEDDGLLGTDPVKNSPPTTKFNSSGVATSNWLAEYQDDPSLINNNVPEYYFIAELADGQTFISADPELQVNKLSGGTFLTGDANKDGAVDLTDMSILLSNWNKTSNFIDALDLNLDGVVNSIDWSTMIQVLKVNGVIK